MTNSRHHGINGQPGYQDNRPASMAQLVFITEVLCTESAQWSI